MENWKLFWFVHFLNEFSLFFSSGFRRRLRWRSDTFSTVFSVLYLICIFEFFIHLFIVRRFSFTYTSPCALSASTPQVEVCAVVWNSNWYLPLSLSWKLKTINSPIYAKSLCKARFLNLNNIIVKPSGIHWSWRRATFHFHNCSLKLSVLALKIQPELPKSLSTWWDVAQLGLQQAEFIIISEKSRMRH